MNSLIDLLSRAGDAFVSILLLPFDQDISAWGLALVSIITGVIFLLIYGRVSFQSTIKRIKNSIHASLLEAVLFRHDLPTSLKAQGKMFWYGVLYFLVAVPPILVLMVPCIIVLAQLELRYGSRPLKIGETTVMVVRFTDPSLVNEVQLAHGQGVAVTPPVRSLNDAEIAWRINPRQQGVHPLTLEIPSKGVVVEERLAVGENPGVIETGAYSSWWMRLFYPSSHQLDAKSGPIYELRIQYPEARINFLGLQMHWLVIFAVLSILTGIVASRIFRVEI